MENEGISPTSQNGQATWPDFWKLVDVENQFISELGIRCGDVLPVLMKGGNRFVQIVEACLAKGVVVVPLSPSIPSKKLREIISQTGCSVIISENALESDLGMAKKLDDLHFIELNPGQTNKTPSKPPEGTALLMYTSGTTGAPK